MHIKCVEFLWNTQVSYGMASTHCTRDWLNGLEDRMKNLKAISYSKQNLQYNDDE